MSIEGTVLFQTYCYYVTKENLCKQIYVYSINVYVCILYFHTDNELIRPHPFFPL